MMLFLDFFGRFHPLLLHLPIGILVYAYMQWGYDIWKKKSTPTDLNFALIIGCVSSILSAWSGWLLAEQGGYDQELLAWHKYLGIGTAVGIVILLCIYNMKSSKLLFGVLFTGFMGILGATGHYGGSLTHGKDFLTKSIAKTEEKEVADIQEAHIFNDVVMPIFERKCVSCHNPEKSKGDLLFHNIEGWEKGGKNGAVIKAGAPSESHILQRAYLPKEDEEHMPPDGKLQLSIDELNFLEWWIAEMTTYDHIVKDLKPTGKVAKYLKSLEGDEFAGIEKVDLDELDALRQYGISATAVSSSSPWVDVIFVAKANAKSGLEKLQFVAKNVIEIDLSNTDISDDDLKTLGQFENLKKLNLSGTTIGNSGIKNLRQLSNLSNLNLYKTKVDDAALDYLADVKSLTKVYLWQTNIDKTETIKWANQNTNIDLDLGVDQSMFGSPKLVAPIIETEAKLFKDSLLVTLNTSNPRAKIIYKTKARNESKEEEYIEPISIEESCALVVFLTQEGWTNSDTISKTFIRTKYKASSIALSAKANEKYPGDGSNTLIDYVKASESFGDGKWLGFYGKDVIATLDLGDSKPIESINVGSLSDGRSYIFPPKSIVVETSLDGKEYSLFAKKDYGIPKGFEETQTKDLLVFADKSQARYVRVKIESLKENPKWHPAPGAPCWLFLDEILVQ